MPGMSRPLPYIVLLAKVAAVVAWFLGLPTGPALLLFFGPGLVLLWHVLVPSAQGLGRVFTHFETNQPEVWLTIDDGPDEQDTPRALDLLDKHGARATFFLIGERAARLPQLVQEIQRRGHSIGHHTHTHPAGTFWCSPPYRVRAELDHAFDAYAAGGARPQWFRAPAGIKSLFLDRALQQRALTCVGWTVRSWDTVRKDPRQVVTTVTNAIRPGAIVLLHEGARLHPAVRERALADLLTALTNKGFACIVPDPAQLR